jgi:hypothetical protein
MNESRIEAVLGRYRRAFLAANGHAPPQIIDKGRGWFKMVGYGPMRRLRDFEEWSDRLERRVSGEPAGIRHGRALLKRANEYRTKTRTE